MRGVWLSRLNTRARCLLPSAESVVLDQHVVSSATKGTVVDTSTQLRWMSGSSGVCPPSVALTNFHAARTSPSLSACAPVTAMCRGVHAHGVHEMAGRMTGPGALMDPKGMNDKLGFVRQAGVTQTVSRAFCAAVPESPVSTELEDTAAPEKTKIGYRGVNPLFRLPVGYYDGCLNKNRNQRRRMLQRELFKRLEAVKRKTFQKAANVEKERKKLIRWKARAVMKKDWAERRAADAAKVATVVAGEA